jgi:hypothetical protein
MKSSKEKVKDLVNFVETEMNASKTIKTHEVLADGKVDFQGTKDACKLYIAANGPLCEIYLGTKLKMRKIK